MANTRTVVQIVDKSLNKIAEIKNLYPINNTGMVLRYSKELSDWGKCTFRVSTKDPIFDTLGDILQPHVYGVRILRGGATVWSGAIVDNLERNRNYIEVQAAEYEFYLDRVLIRRDAEVTTGDGKDNYRTFSSGTMATAVLDLVNKAKTDFGTVHPLGAMTVDSANVQNPDYPQGFTDQNNIALTGGWNFTSFITLQFDYHSVYYVLKAFGLYTNCDFEIDEDLTFKFKKFLGNKETGITFSYGTQGNIIDYHAPRLGTRMANNLWGIGADNDGNVLHANQIDTASQQRYGLLQDAKGYADVKALNFLKTRINEELQFTKTFDDTALSVVLNEKSYPLGQYDIGDIVTIKIKDNAINLTAQRRIVGITVTVHNTGREITAVQTNIPKAKDLAA